MDGTSDSLATAVALGSPDLLMDARAAFTASVHVIGILCALIFAGLAAPTVSARPTRL